MLNKYSNKPIAYITGGNPECWRYLRFFLWPRACPSYVPNLNDIIFKCGKTSCFSTQKGCTEKDVTCPGLLAQRCVARGWQPRSVLSRVLSCVLSPASPPILSLCTLLNFSCIPSSLLWQSKVIFQIIKLNFVQVIRINDQKMKTIFQKKKTNPILMVSSAILKQPCYGVLDATGKVGLELGAILLCQPSHPGKHSHMPPRPPSVCIFPL